MDCIKSTVFAVLLVALSAFAAPHSGEEFELSQPDGSTVPVLVWGDEFHQDVESIDGYTLVRGEDGWICYAELSADGSEYVPTGVLYSGKMSVSPVLQKNKRINRESFEKKHRRNREILGFDNESFVPRDKRRNMPKISPANAGVSPASIDAGVSPAPVENEPEKWVGLTVLMDFPGGQNPSTGAINNAVKSNVARQSMEYFANREGGFNGGAGSVRDYYLDVSNGLLDYSNVVTDFVTVAYPKNYYDTLSNYQFVPELIQSALYEIKKRVESGQLDISAISTNAGRNGDTVVALNLLYAGSASQGWSNGIWPHQGTYRAPSNSSLSVRNGVVPGGTITISVPASGSTPAKTIRFNRYQLASLGTGANPPGIGTFVHENGHMIMRWPDLYPYDETVTNVISGYCVMGSSNGSNPQPPNPFFKSLAGWIDVTDITNANATLTSVANEHHAYQYKRDGRESYFIEARSRTGRSSALPGQGLIVWHVHTSGQNTTIKNTAPYPLLKVVQANVASSTTVAFPPAPNQNAPFRSSGGSNNTKFHAQSSPPARYYDGTLSNIMLTEVSAITSENNMTFRIGTEEGESSSSSSDSPSSSSSLPSSSSSAIPSSSSSLPSSSSIVTPSSSSSLPQSSSSSLPQPSSSSLLQSSSSSDIQTPIRLSRIASGNSATKIHNGINLQAASSAVVSVYNLTGRGVLHKSFAPGAHTVSFGDLPKGMYMVSVRFGSEKIMLRAVVK